MYVRIHSQISMLFQMFLLRSKVAHKILSFYFRDSAISQYNRPCKALELQNCTLNTDCKSYLALFFVRFQIHKTMETLNNKKA